MKKQICDVVDRHKSTPAVIALHGPSLNLTKKEIIQTQKENKIVRFSVNDWYDYFDTPPDYWILSTSEPKFLIKNLLPMLENLKVPVFFSDDGDFTSKELINNSLESEWLCYDQRHWEFKNCLQILKTFKEHHTTHKNFSFKKYGNNEIMWHPPRCLSMSGHSLDGRCCQQNSPPRVTIQEELQNISGCNRHYSTGDTVALHAIAFAIIMGCNPIYVTGLDLDYSDGYADDSKNDWQQKASGPNAWMPVRQNLENDLNILNESAENRGIKIINLNPNAWYESFEISDFVV
tara:strand:+ start:5706 stop:6575 length:870 start_codon:yes stop_codon:yes gene_type:complete